MSYRLPLAPVPQRYRLVSLLLCPVLLLAVGCRRATLAGPALSINHQISPQPVRVGPATISIQIADAARKPLSSATVELEANMAHPGMAPVFGNVAETSPGNYRAQLRFDMPGDWVVSLRIKLPDGQTVQKTMDVRGIQPN